MYHAYCRLLQVFGRDCLTPAEEGEVAKLFMEIAHAGGVLERIDVGRFYGRKE